MRSQEAKSPEAPNGQSEAEVKPVDRPTGARQGGQVETQDSTAATQATADLIRSIRNLVDSPSVVKLLDILATRINHDGPHRIEELKLRREALERNAKFYSRNRAYFLVGLVICFAFLGVIMWIFREKPDTLLPVLTAVIGLVAGAGGGFIFGQQRRDDSTRH